MINAIKADTHIGIRTSLTYLLMGINMMGIMTRMRITQANNSTIRYISITMEGVAENHFNAMYEAGNVSMDMVPVIN